MTDLPQDKPKFDPSKPVEPVDKPEAKVVPIQEEEPKGKPKFDPDKPFQETESPKKKESTSAGSDDFGAHTWPPKLPSDESSPKSTSSKPPYKEEEKDGFFESAYKGASGLVKDILPKSFFTAQAAGTRTTPYTEKDVNDLKSIHEAANYLFRKKISEGKFMEALSIGDKEAREYISEQVKKPEEFQKQQIETKLSLLKKADKERQEFEEYTKGTVKTLSAIESPSDVASYVAYNVGQTIPQIGVSLLTGGMGAYIQEYSDIYDKQVQKIAEDKGITPTEVVQQELDDPAAGEGAALLAAALDRVGVEAIFKNFGKDALKAILKSASKIEVAKKIGKAALVTATTEGVTEGAQYVVEETGSSMAAGRTIEQAAGDVDSRELLESVAAGATAGLFLGGAGEVTSTIRSKPAQEVVNEVTTEVNPDNPVQVEAAAEVLQAKIDQVTNNESLTPQQAAEELQKEEPITTTQEEQVNTGDQTFQNDDDKVYEVIPRPTTGLTQGKNFDYMPNKFLPEEGKQTEAEFAKDLDENFDAKKKEYVEKFGNVLDADKAKELSEEYVKDPQKNAESVHNPGSSFLFRLYTDMLKEDAPEGKKNKVTFIVGGAAAGKTTTVEATKNDDSQIIYDTLFGDIQISKNQINRALNAKKNVVVKYVYRDPADAFESMVQRAGETGRLVPLSVFVKSHVNSKSTIAKAEEEYKGNKRVSIQTVKNTDKPVRTVTEEELTKELIDKTEKMYTDGKISESVYNRILGKKGGDQGGGQTKSPPIPPASTPPGSKQAALGARVESSSEPEGIKSRVAGKDRYMPRKIIQTDEEAKKILDDWNDSDFAEWAIRDVSNEIPAGTRGTLAANLYQQYKKEAESATDDATKNSLYDKAADIAVWAQNNMTRAGQETAVAGKVWKSIMSNEDLLVIAMEKQNAQQAKKLITPIQQEVTDAKQQFDDEIRRVIEQKVTEGVEQRLARAKLITTDKKKQIADAFDKLKIKDVKGTANDIVRVVGSAVWNGSLEAVKRAVLTGADVANAVQAGIDYVRSNYKGADFSEDEYKSMLTPSVTEMIVPVPITPEQVDANKIKTKGIKGKRKKDFMNKLIEAHNAGKLTDAKFEEIYAEKMGHKPFSPEERSKIRDLAKTIAEVEKFKEAVQKNFTAENIKKYQGMLKDARKANKELQQYNNRNPASIWDTLATMMQGNLLSPISLLTNIYANVAYQPLRFATALTGGIVDRGLTELAKTNLLGENVSNIIGKKPTIDLVALQKGYFPGGWNGIMEGLYQLGTGPLAEDRALREIQSPFSPTNAIRRWADKDRTLSQKINDAIEGTLGWPPEVVFRLLNLGDKPFKRSAELARAYEIAAEKKLTGPDLLKFIMFPDSESQQQIEEAGKEATFQNESTLAKIAEAIVSTILNGGRIKGAEIPGIASIPIIGGPLKVIAKTQIPFVRTPANILAKTFNYAIPPLTFIRGVYNISKGNKRTGSMLIGDALVGMMMYAVGKMLVEAGLMTWTPDQRDDKAKQAMYGNEPPNSINITAINRGLMGDSWQSQDDDIWVSYQKLGLTGIVLQNYANQYYHAVKDGKEPFADIVGDIGLSGVKTTASALDQSFLTGTNTFLEALKDPEGYAGDRWIIGTTEALTATVLPRTLTSIGAASDEYIRDTRDPKVMNALANTFKAKMFMGDQLPARVNVWGEKVAGNPEGRNRMVYYLFDPTKFKSVDQESYKYKIYKAWKDNGFENDYLPGSPKREVTVKEIKIKLTAQEFEKLATYVGEARARRAALYASNRDKLDVEKLTDIYEKGLKDGKKRFLMDAGWKLLSKSELEKMAEDR